MYNLHDMSYLEDLNQYLGKKGADFGGKRRKSNKK
jgi:hypothetical protein